MNYFSKYKWWRIALLLLFIANIATLVLVWLVRTGPVDMAVRDGGRPPEATEFLIKELDFSTSQAGAYRELFKQHQQEVKAIRDSIRKSKDRFFAMIGEDEVTNQQLQERAYSSARLQQQLDVLTFKHFRQVKELCDARQQEKFDDVIQNVIRRMAPQPRGGEGQSPGRPRFNRPPPGGEHSQNEQNGPPPNDAPPND